MIRVLLIACLCLRPITVRDSGLKSDLIKEELLITQYVEDVRLLPLIGCVEKSIALAHRLRYAGYNAYIIELEKAGHFFVITDNFMADPFPEGLNGKIDAKPIICRLVDMPKKYRKGIILDIKTEEGYIEIMMKVRERIGEGI